MKTDLKLSIVAVAACAVRFAVCAAPFEARVPTEAVGAVEISCEDADGWTFDVKKSAAADGVILDLSAVPRRLAVFDALGRESPHAMPSSAGLVRIAVPSGGHAEIE